MRRRLPGVAGKHGRARELLAAAVGALGTIVRGTARTAQAPGHAAPRLAAGLRRQEQRGSGSGQAAGDEEQRPAM